MSQIADIQFFSIRSFCNLQQALATNHLLSNGQF